MSDNKRKSLLNKIVNSYLLVNQEEPYKKLNLLQKYLKAKKIANVNIRELKEIVDNQIKSTKNQDKLENVEAELFKKNGGPRNYKYGSAFCKKCKMYKDYEKECPYCGSLEMTL